jgi:DNA repair protein RecO
MANGQSLTALSATLRLLRLSAFCPFFFSSGANRYAHRVATVMDDAICIRVWDWSETSQTVSLFCRSRGVVRGLAKGSKRQDARFSGGYELFTRGQAGVLIKNHDSLATLTAWDLSEIFLGVRKDLARFHVAMAMLDLTHHMIRDHDPHEAMFDAMVKSGRRLADDGKAVPAAALLQFLWITLVECGYRPDLTRDVRGECELEAQSVKVFVPRLGGFSSRLEAGEDAWRVRAQTVELLRQLDAGLIENADGDAMTRAVALLAACVREVLGQPVVSLDSAVLELRKRS